MWQPDITVAAICERNGRFLLVEERAKSNNKIVFNQPAGHLEQDESLVQAVVRETLEETCRHFTPQALVGFYRLTTPVGKTYIRAAFCGEVSSIDDSRLLDEDIIATHWLTHQQIEAHQSLRSELVLSCIRDYLAGIRYPLDILREL